MADKRFDIDVFEKVDDTKIRIKGKVLWNELDGRLKEIYNELSRSVRMKGFRPGRVPRSLLRKMFGKQVEPSIIEEAVKEAVVEYLTDLSKNQGVYYDKNPNNWQIDAKDISNGEDLEFSVELEALTEVEVKDYKNLNLTRYVVEVKDEEVEAELQKMVKEAVKEIPVEEGTVEQGMVVSLKYMGKIGDDPIEIENFTDRKVEALEDVAGRHDAMLLDFVAAHLAGRDVKEITEDEFDMEFDVPADAAAKELAGKKARLLVEVSSVRRTEEPALDDEFAKDQGKENLDELRSEIRTRLEKEKERKSEELLERDLVNILIENNPITVGDNLLRTQTESLVEGFMAMIGLRLDYLPQEQKEDFLARYRDMAERSLLSVVLLEAIARQEGVELTDEDLDDYLRHVAETRNESFERVKAEYEKEKDPTTRELALHRKVMKWLIEQSSVEEKVVDEFPKDESESSDQDGADDSARSEASSEEADSDTREETKEEN